MSQIWANLTKLRHLDLSFNAIESVPCALGSLAQLQYLDLAAQAAMPVDGLSALCVAGLTKLRYFAAFGTALCVAADGVMVARA